MQASNIFCFKTLLSSLAIAGVLLTPCAFAKKDLFANDPSAKQSFQTEQLVSPVSSSSSSASSRESAQEEALADIIKNEEKVKSPVAQATTDTDPEQKSSFFGTQFSRLKGHLIEAKDDLFGNKKSAKKESVSVPQQTEASLTDNTRSSEESHSEVPTISAAEAAQRAQSVAEGQVINVRKYQEENQPRYAVKLLQKNGRMKTINLDAVSGAVIEETPQ